MNENVMKLMQLQGDIRIMLMEAGIDQMRSLAVSGEVLHLLATSPLVTESVRAAYASITRASPFDHLPAGSAGGGGAMKARDVDMHDVAMMRKLADFWRNYYDDQKEAGRLDAIAGLLSRHLPELAECEHGALRGRCTVDPCEIENFESDHVVNRAVDVRDQVCDSITLAESIFIHSFTAEDFRALLDFAWIGARVSAVAVEPSARAPQAEGERG